MPRLSRAALSEVEKMIKVVPPGAYGDETVNAAIFEALRSAASERKSIYVTYETFSTGETSRRLLDPYVLEVREGCWHVIGYCHLRDSVRDFRISRIKATEPADAKFAVPEDFYEQYQRTRFDKLAGQEICDIRVEFRGHAARLVREYHAQKADGLTQSGDAVVFVKRAAITPDLIQWLLSFGADAKVLEPRVLAD
jgi:proteasome accessory factor B